VLQDERVGVRVICDGGFTLPLSSDEALPLFTPEGERGWAGEDWDPVYAAARTDEDGATPGTVFTTQSTGGDAIWLVVESTGDSIRYARVVPGRIAGTIRVACAADADGCRVRVTYDITSLGPDGDGWAREFEQHYDGFMQHWRDAIVATLTSA
jgi:hypothetical protein